MSRNKDILSLFGVTSGQLFPWAKKSQQHTFPPFSLVGHSTARLSFPKHSLHCWSSHGVAQVPWSLKVYGPEELLSHREKSSQT